MMINIMKRLREELHKPAPVEQRQRTKLRLRRAEILALKREADRRSRDAVSENRSD
jgi:hypothetical protein